MFQIDIGSNIREIRKLAGLTQAQLAERANIALAALQRLEGPNGNPTLKTLFAIADGLGVPFLSLFGVEGGSSTPTQSTMAETILLQQNQIDRLKSQIIKDQMRNSHSDKELNEITSLALKLKSNNPKLYQRLLSSLRSPGNFFNNVGYRIIAKQIEFSTFTLPIRDIIEFLDALPLKYKNQVRKYLGIPNLRGSEEPLSRINPETLQNRDQLVTTFIEGLESNKRKSRTRHHL